MRVKGNTNNKSTSGKIILNTDTENDMIRDFRNLF